VTEQPSSLRVLAADDEPMARASLRRLLARERDVELLGVCADGIEALAELKRTRPDLVLLDIQMPERSGLEVMRAIPDEQRPLVIFTTAHKEFAVDAFEVHAVDYLLKPFDDARFVSAMERAREEFLRTRALGSPGRLRSLLQDASAEGEGAQDPRSARLKIQREGSTTWVDIEEVVWIESADQYVRLHTVDGGDHLMRESMAKLERSLDTDRFARVHRSAIVQLGRVRRLESTGAGGGRLFLDDGQEVPVSRSRLSALRRRLA